MSPSIFDADLFPGVSLENVGAPEFTQPGNLFIYSWPAEEQARCPGTVVALEYCYGRRRSSLPPSQPVFVLILLEQDTARGGYNVTQMVEVTALNSSNCTNREGVNTCCERQRLDPQKQFDVPSPSIMFGISATGDDSILGYRLGQENETVGFVIKIDAIQNGFITLNGGEPLTYRMFNFIIGKIIPVDLLHMCCDTYLYNVIWSVLLCYACRYRRIKH